MENLASPRFDSRTVQPIGSRYTDYATRPTITAMYNITKYIIAALLLRLAFAMNLHFGTKEEIKCINDYISCDEIICVDRTK